MRKNIRRIYKLNIFSLLLALFIAITGCSFYEPDLDSSSELSDTESSSVFEEELTEDPKLAESISECTNPKQHYLLPDGYIYRYLLTPIYSGINQLAISTDIDGLIFNNCGYQDNSRIRSVFEIGESKNTFVTGFIPVKANDIIYFNSGCFNPQYENANIMYTVFYNESKEILFSTSLQRATETAFEIIESHSEGYFSAIKIKELSFADNLSYMRFTLVGSGLGQMISINEALIPISYEYTWVQTEKYITADWYEEIKTTIGTINDISLAENSNTIKFMFASDIHLDPNSKSSYTQNIGKVASAVMRTCNIPFFITAGDNCTQSAGFLPEDFKINMQQVLAQLEPIPQKNILSTVGNHDGATGIVNDANGNPLYYRLQLTNKERSSVFFDWQRESNENKIFDSDGTYYYLDDSASQTRYIVLNSFWSKWKGNEEGFVDNTEHSFFHSPLFGQKQLSWFAEVALDMPSGYDAIIVTHFAPAAKDFKIFKGIVDAYTSRSSYQGKYEGLEDWQSSSISVNYENMKNEIIAIFQGHNHTNAEYNFFQNVPCINITTTGAYWDVRDENAEKRIKETASEFAVDAVTIDRKNRKIYCTRLGAGNDRVVSY